MFKLNSKISNSTIKSSKLLNEENKDFFSFKELGILLLIGIFSRIFIIFLFYIIRYFADSNRTFEQMISVADYAYYRDIVQYGYATLTSGNPGTWSFFPFYPLLAKIVVLATHVSSFTALIVVSHLSFLISLPLFYLYTKKFVDSNIAWFATILVAFSPHSIYFTVPYAESTYFLLILLTMYLARSNHQIATGVSGAMLSATRPLGVFTLFAVIAVQIEKYGWRCLFNFRQKSWPMWFGFLLFPFGLFAYMAYMHFYTGLALAFKFARVGWGGGMSFKLPFVRIFNKYMFKDPMFVYYSIVICFAIFGTIYLIRKRLWGDALILFITPFIMTMLQNNFGIPRFVFALYPIYLVLGFLTRTSIFSRIILFLFCLITNIYYVWGWFNIKEFIG